VVSKRLSSSFEERNWCKQKNLDVVVLREVALLADEVKKRFKQL